MFSLLITFSLVFILANAQLLQVIENHLSESQKDIILGTALISIGKTTQKKVIANDIANEVTKNNGGQWYAIVAQYNANDSNFESSSSFPVNKNKFLCLQI